MLPPTLLPLLLMPPLLLPLLLLLPPPLPLMLRSRLLKLLQMPLLPPPLLKWRQLLKWLAKKMRYVRQK